MQRFHGAVQRVAGLFVVVSLAAMSVANSAGLYAGETSCSICIP